MSFSDFWVIIFFEQSEPQSEGSRHTDLRIKLLPARALTTMLADLAVAPALA